MKKYLPIFLSLLLILILTTDMDAQCAMCKKVAEGKDPNSLAPVGKNINYAILYLMAVPYFAIVFIFRKQIGDFIKGFRNKTT